MPFITFVTFDADFFSSVSFFSDEESVISSTSIAAKGGIKLSVLFYPVRISWGKLTCCFGRFNTVGHIIT